MKKVERWYQKYVASEIVKRENYSLATVGKAS